MHVNFITRNRGNPGFGYDNMSSLLRGCKTADRLMPSCCQLPGGAAQRTTTLRIRS